MMESGAIASYNPRGSFQDRPATSENHHDDRHRDTDESSVLEGPRGPPLGDRGACTSAKLFADDPGRGERLTAEAARASTSTTPRTGSPTRRSSSCSSWPRSAACRAGSTPCSAGEKINVTEDRAVLHVALRAPKGRVDRRRRRGRRARRSTPCSTRWPRFADRVRSGRVEGAHRQADPERRQHRHRRLRPRPGHGLRGAPALQPTAT